VGHDARGAIVLRKNGRVAKWKRARNIPPCLIGMEPWRRRHHLSRKLASLGHDAGDAAKYVRPYSKDREPFNDAEAIAEPCSARR